MTKFLTKRNVLITSVAGVLLIGGVTFKAFADGHDGFGGRSLTLDSMLEKVGENFDDADTDANGIVTAAEADAARSAKQAEMGARMDERLVSMFERMDSDGDGIITEGDRGYGRLSDRLDLEGDLTLDQVQAASAQKRAERVAEHELETIDSPVSYPQTREDALAAAQAKFAAADTDGDGILSASEMEGQGFGGRHGRGQGGGHRSGDNKNS